MILPGLLWEKVFPLIVVVVFWKENCLGQRPPQNFGKFFYKKGGVQDLRTRIIFIYWFQQAAASVHMDFHLMESFAHAGQCENLKCQRKCCVQLMQVASHAKTCALVKQENSLKCHLCRQVLALCAIHLENCQVSFGFSSKRRLRFRTPELTVLAVITEFKMLHTFLHKIQKM